MKPLWKNAMVVGGILGVSAMSSALYAESMYEPNLYLGVAAGRVDVNDSEFEDDDMAAKVYIGGRFGKYLGIEASANDFGESSTDVSEWELNGATLALVGMLPITERFELFVKAGNLWWEADASLGDADDDFDGSERFAGVGAKFNFNENLSLRLEYERFKVELDEDEIGPGFGVDVDTDSKVNVATAGIQFNF